MHSLRSICAMLIVLVLAGVSIARNGIYANEITLFSDVVQKSPDKARPHNNLGNALKEARRIDEARVQFEAALRIDAVYPDALNNLATIYNMQGRKDEGLDLLQRALALNPDHLPARFNLAMRYYETGMLAEAEREYALICAIAPQSKEAAFARRMLAVIRNR